MNKTLLVLAILMAAGLSTKTFANGAKLDQVIDLGPSDAANGPLANGSASIDTTASQTPSDDPAGTGSWQANGTAASQYYLYADDNSPDEQGLGQLTINSLTSLSFSTFETPAQAAAAPNWYLIIYTAPYAGGEASWYGNRLILEPYLANNYTPGAGNQWVTWSTASSVNQLTLDDSALSGNQGFYGQPTLANVQSGPITWSALTADGSSTPITYGDQNIEGIVLSTGSGWAAGFTGLVNDVNIDTNPGNVQFDLQAVPEPTTLALAGLGLGMLFLYRRKK